MATRISSRSATAALASLAVCTVALVVHFRDRPTENGPGEPTGAGANIGANDADAQSTADHARAQSSTDESREAVPPGRLHISVVDGHQRPLAGTVGLSFSPRIPAFPPAAPPDPHEHSGSISVDVPPGHWTWVSASCGARTAWSVVSPFEGERRELVQFGGDATRVHVFVVADDLHTPVVGRQPSLFVASPAAGGFEPVELDAPTDEAGHMVLDALPQGGYLVTAPGLGPETGPPQAARFTIHAGNAGREQVHSIVLAEETRTIRLLVFGEFEPEPRQPVVLYLKRKDDDSGAHFPIGQPIVPGPQELRLDVPCGLYEVEVLPLGTLTIPADRRLLHVTRDGQPEFVLPIQANERRVTVSLDGMHPRHDTPFALYPRPVGTVLDDTPHMMFTGPLTWRTLTQEIGCPGFRCRLVAMKTNGYWLSGGELDLAPGIRTIDMSPASMLTIRWLDAVVRERVVAAIETRLGTELRGLRRQIIRADGARRAALVGEIVVPYGAVRVTCYDESGESAWQRAIDVAHPHTELTEPRVP